MLQFFRKKRNQKGFTLIELLTVITIIGVLALIAIPMYNNAQATARGAKIEADLRSIDSACSMAVAAGVTPSTTTLPGAYLAKFPTPPAGAATLANGHALTVAADATYTVAVYPATNGTYRGLYGGKPVEEL